MISRRAKARTTKKPTKANSNSKNSANATRGNRLIFHKQRRPPCTSRQTLRLPRQQTPQQRQHNTNHQPAKNMVRPIRLATNTPRADGHSPAQLFMGRRQQTIKQLHLLNQEEIKSAGQRRDEEIPKTEEYEKIKSMTSDMLAEGKNVLV